MAGVMGYIIHDGNIRVHSGSDGVHGGSINLKACIQNFHLLHNIGMYHAANQSYNTFLKELGYFDHGFQRFSHCFVVRKKSTVPEP